MDLQFQKSTISCLEAPLREIQNMEEAQELKLSEAMPDIGRILGAWGQVILRGKDWRTDTLGVSGGVQVWVLYGPEDGSQPQCLEGWIPFQTRWDLPDQIPEGQIRLNCLLRFVDARGVSPRRIMVRTGVAIRAEAFCPVRREVFTSEKAPEQIALREKQHALLLAREAGEKTFSLEEELPMPGSVPKPEKLISYRVCPAVSDKKVLADKVVFRGNARLHVLYRSEEGQFVTWDFEMPFSQYAQLDQSWPADAQADVVCCVTGLEAELDEEGRICCQCDLTGQYLILAREQVKLVEDAYSPGRELSLQMQTLELPVWQESRREMMAVEQSIPMDADVLAEVQILPDFPRQRSREGSVETVVPGTTQALYYGTDGTLQGTTARWEANGTYPVKENWEIQTTPMYPEDPQVILGTGSASVRMEMPVQLETTEQLSLPMVTGMTLGQQTQPDPERPSLILRRAGKDDLWELAKVSGSTEQLIRSANGLEGDPIPGQMLLIPVL